jgi:hypothetical protein
MGFSFVVSDHSFRAQRGDVGRTEPDLLQDLVGVLADGRCPP